MKAAVAVCDAQQFGSYPSRKEIVSRRIFQFRHEHWVEGVKAVHTSPL